MNFQKIYDTRGMKDDKGYAIKTDMFGVLTMVGGAEQAGQGYKSKCKVRDDTGTERTVTFLGRDLPQNNMLNHRVLFSCWAEDWFSQKLNKNMTSFSAWLKNANVAQNPPQNQPQAVQQPRQATNTSQGSKNAPDWDAIAEGKVRHGVVCAGIEAGKLQCNNIGDVAFWVKYIIDGKEPEYAAPEPEDLPPNFMEGVDEPPFDQKYNLEG